MGARGGQEGPRGAMSRAGRPRLGLLAEDVARGHLELLQAHGKPAAAGAGPEPLEVCYAFADLDPLEPESYSLSSYFGERMDLGQFQHFKRIMLGPRYRVLLGHTRAELQSCLQVGEGWVRYRYWVTGWRPGEECVYEFSLARRCGGRQDGCWFVRQLLRDDSARPEHSLPLP